MTVVNGSSNRCVWWWAQHLQSEENDNVRVVKSYGLRSETIEDMLEEMMERAQGTKCENPFYQMNINPAPGEILTEKDWERVRGIAEKKHGLEGQPYFMVMHVKYGREHPHFIYSRIDLENMRAISDSLDAKKNHAIAREIEREFGLQKTIGPYDREQGTPRPPRAPKKYEMYRDKQNGLDTRDIQAEVSELYQQSQDGKDFHAALEEHGYRLATGRRGLLILDSAGNEHSLARRCGVPMKEVLSFMHDVDLKTVPTVEHARVQYQERKIAGLEADRATVRAEIEWHEALERAAIAKEKTEGKYIAPEDREKEIRAGREQAQAGSRKERSSPIDLSLHPSRPGLDKAATEATRDNRAENLKGPAAHVWAAWQQSDSAQAFAAALDDKGIAFAAVTAEEAARSHREATFAREIGNRAPRIREGEIVIVTEPRPEYRRNGEIIKSSRIHKLDQSLAEKFTKHLGTRSQLQGIDATLKASDQRAQRRAADWEAIRDVYAETRLHRNRTTAVEKGIHNGAATTRDAIHKSTVVIEKTLSIAASVGKVFETVGSLIEGIAAPKLTPQQIHDGEKAKDRREAEAETTIDFSRITAEAAQQRQQQEQDREAERQRDGGGRER